MTEHRTITINTASILKTVLILILLWFLFIIRDIIGIVFVAFVIASALDPMVDWLEKKRIPRVVSVATLAVVLLGILSSFAALIIPPLIDEIRQLATHLPDVYNAVTKLIIPFDVSGSQNGVVGPLERNLQSISQGLLQLTTGVFGALTSAFGSLAALITVLVISFYMTVEEQGMRKLIKAVSPSRYQPYLQQLVKRIQAKMGSWFRGQLLLSAIDGTLTFVGLTLLHVRFALILALLTAFLRIIPYIGPILSAVPAVLIAATDTSLFWGGVVGAYFLVYNQIVDNLVVPKVMQQTVGLHPILILVILLIGARLGGIVGTIISIPIGTIVAIFLQDFMDERRSKDNELEEAHA